MINDTGCARLRARFLLRGLAVQYHQNRDHVSWDEQVGKGKRVNWFDSFTVVTVLEKVAQQVPSHQLLYQGNTGPIFLHLGLCLARSL